MQDKLTEETADIEDISQALQEGRPIRDAGPYRIAFSDQGLDFRPITIHDPVPLGRQILTAAGIERVGDYSLFAILPGGDFEDVRLDETFDLRAKGAERFVAFETDRDYRLTLNDDQLRWGKPVISGKFLYTLANISGDQAVFLEVRGGEDRLVEPDDHFDLSAPGVERFITAPRIYKIFVNSRPKTVAGRLVTFEQIVQLAFPGSHEANVEFSMTYRHAASRPPAGELGTGGTIEIKNGTTFNVTRTVQS